MNSNIVFTTSDQMQKVKFTYTNWKGKTRQRQAIFYKFFLGSNQYHPTQQWLVTGYDLEKEAERTFALENITKIENIDEK